MTKTAVAESPLPISTIEERFERAEIGRVYESPLNPRKTFPEDPGFEASVREKGIIEPLVVREGAGGKLEIIAGARRKRAAVKVGLAQVPVIIRAYTDAQALEIMAIENGQRASVPPLEEAEGYKRLLLIEQTYTAAMIASKIGHDERYVWNRLRLLELIPEAQQLLRAGIIGVEHAEVLAKLKDADQKRAISRQTGGLFDADNALEFDDRPRLGSTAYDRVKPVSVRELKQWVATNIRLDVAFAGTAAPLDFGETAQRVAAAEENGRGQTPVPIVFSHMCPYTAADAKERTYGASAWKRAHTKDGEASCEYARLGFVVAGEHYGESFMVCINRDKCLTHWKDSVKAKEKAAALRAKGDTKKAATVEKKQEDNYAEKQRRDDAERRARETLWEDIESLVTVEAAAQVKGVKRLTAAQAKFLEDDIREGYQVDDLRKVLGATWFKTPAAALLVLAVTNFSYNGWNTKESGFNHFVKRVAKPLGLDVKRLAAIRDTHTPKAETPAPATKKAAKK